MNFSPTPNALTTRPHPPFANMTCEPIPTQPGPFAEPTFLGIELRMVHIADDLYSRGCDIWNPFSIQCRAASYEYCVANGYIGGYGPIQYNPLNLAGQSGPANGNFANVACFGKDVAQFMTIPYSGQCVASAPSSIFCEGSALSSCRAAGFPGTTGVVSATDSSIGIQCLNASSGAQEITFSGISVLQNQGVQNTSCSFAGILSDTGCQTNAQSYCNLQGFQVGFNANSLQGPTGGGGLTCAHARQVNTNVRGNPTVGVLSRPAIIGTMEMGGAAFNSSPAKGSTPANGGIDADYIYNGFDYPIVVTSAAPLTTYVGSTYSSDNCFTLQQACTTNGGANYQVPNSWNGELMCVYSSEKSIPSMNYGQFGRGVLLAPGDTIIYTATPQWKVPGTGLYNIATVTFAAAAGYTPMRRWRVPQWDSGFPNVSARPGAPNTVWAGCNATSSPVNCPYGPGVVATAMWPNQNIPPSNSNDWYVARFPTAVRGITIFANNSVNGNIRVVKEGGMPYGDPFHFNYVPYVVNSVPLLGPDAFNLSFGTNTGSAFIPIDMDVPQGALVGVDFSFPSGGDFGGYVWLDQSNAPN